jgi:4-azaleucine resistance transporter AzlC
MHSRSAEFWGGVRAQLPILLGVSPFGMIYGILAIDAGLPVAVALGMSMIVFAGSSQFIAAELFATGTPGVIVVLTTFVVNLRHMLYSASLAPYLKHLSRAWKYAIAFLLTDEAYAVAITHYEQPGDPPARLTYKHWYTLGAGLTLWTAWQGSTAIGVLLGASVPESWALDFTLALTFIALVMPALKDRPAIVAALSAGVTAMAAHDLPYNLGLIVAVLAGIGAGLVAELVYGRAQVTTAEPVESLEADEVCS